MIKRKFFVSLKFTFWLLVPLISLWLWWLRAVGYLQYIELAALDRFFQLRPPETLTERIVIVAVEEKDVSEVGYPIAENKLVEVLENIKKQKPAIIGLNLVRNSVGPELMNFLLATPNLIGVEQVSGSFNGYKGRINSIPFLQQTQRTGGIALAVDRVDGRIRRGYLYPYRRDGSAQSRIPSFSWAIAQKYLEPKKIKISAGRDGWLQLQQVELKGFEPWDGGYADYQDDAYSIIVNWMPSGSFPQFSVSDILNGVVEADAFKNRIVLVESRVVGSASYTIPYSGKQRAYQPVSSSEIHANVINHILAAVLDNRPVIWTLPESQEFLFLMSWLAVLASTIFIFRKSSPWKLALASLMSGAIISVVVWQFNFLVFVNYGGWLPLIPILLAIPIFVVIAMVILYIANLKAYIRHLETKFRAALNEIYYPD